MRTFSSKIIMISLLLLVFFSPILAVNSVDNPEVNSESASPMWIGIVAAVAAVFIVLTLRKRQNS
jgi:predicted permease